MEDASLEKMVFLFGFNPLGAGFEGPLTSVCVCVVCVDVQDGNASGMKHAP